MKTNILKSIAVAVVLVVAVVNSNVSAGNKLYSNDEIKNELLVSKTIYSYDGQLKNHLKYNYTYDENARMTSKETLKWNKNNSSWAPCYKLEFSYSEDQMIIELNSWNKQNKAYTNNKQKAIYQLDSMNKPETYVAYQWDSKTKDWKVMNSEISIDNSDLLASQK